MALMARICEACRDSPAYQFFFGDGDGRGSYQLGLLGQVALRDCDLCRLVIRALYPNIDVKGHPDSQLDHDELQAESLCFTKLLKQGDGSDAYILVYAATQTGLRTGHILLCHDTPNGGIESSIPLYCHPQEGQIDFNRIKAWLQRCETTHKKCAPGTARFPGILAAFPPILIDVKSRKLISPEERAPRYIALSYVWGASLMLKTVKKNMEAHQRDHSLTDDKLPAVIATAMHLVDYIGEQFLWVDSLCVVQDGDNIQEYLNQMDLVYNQAVFTIVAIDGQSADDPLPGVLPKSRLSSPKAVKIQDIKFVPSLPMLEQVINRAVHSTRGWTFQETLLSNRCLYVSENQAYFLCREAARCEDRIGDCGDDPQEVNSLLKAQRHDAREMMLGSYRKVVERYIERRFTYSTDICRAFAGISSVLLSNTSSLEIPGENRAFVANMPIFSLLYALLWTPKGVIRRRRCGNVNQFPSWSWAGWEGVITYEHILGLEPQVQSCLYRVQVFDQSNWFYLDEHDKDAGEIHPGSCLIRAQMSRCGYAGNRSAMGSSATNHAHPVRLDFWGYHAETQKYLCIVKTDEEFLSKDRMPLFDSKGEQCGVLMGNILRGDFRDPSYHFITVGAVYQETDDWPFYVMSDRYRSSQSWCTGTDEAGGCLYVIMLAKQHGDVWERVSIGLLHPEAWIAGEWCIEHTILA